MSKSKQVRTADGDGEVAPVGGRPETVARKIYSAVAATIAARIAGIVLERLWVEDHRQEAAEGLKVTGRAVDRGGRLDRAVGNVGHRRAHGGDPSR